MDDLAILGYLRLCDYLPLGTEYGLLPLLLELYHLSRPWSFLACDLASWRVYYLGILMVEHYFGY